MARRIPKYQHFKPRDKAKVVLPGQRPIYLDGAYDSEESHAHYDRVIAEYLACSDEPQKANVTIAVLALRYLEFAKSYYVKGGKATPENGQIRCALQPLVKRYRSLHVSKFGPLKLQKVREDMLSDTSWTRNTINDHIGRIVKMIKWGVSQEAVAPEVFAACRSVENLKKGRCKAPEGNPVPPVEIDQIEAVLPFVGRQVHAMILLQQLTGMRPQEVRLMRLCDVDRSDNKVWEYIPHSHKTEHHGKARRIYLGPKSQAVLRPFFSERDPEEYLLSPLDAYNEATQRRQAKAEGERRQPRTPIAEPLRKPRHGGHYTKDSYNRAILRACEFAFEMPVELRMISKNIPEEAQALLRRQAAEWRKAHCWSPNQLRHTAATELRRQLDLDASRVVLGHSDARTTATYAERDFESAKAIMAELG